MNKKLRMFLIVACSALFVVGTAVAQDRPEAEALEEVEDREGSGEEIQERANPNPNPGNSEGNEDDGGEAAQETGE